MLAVENMGAGQKLVNRSGWNLMRAPSSRSMLPVGLYTDQVPVSFPPSRPTKSRENPRWVILLTARDHDQDERF